MTTHNYHRRIIQTYRATDCADIIMGPIIIVAGQNQRSKFTVFGRHVGRVKMSQLVLARRRTSDMSRDELIVY